MIVNTGSRTDIPAYFSEWFYNRIKEGFVLVRNPYYPGQVMRYRLTPDVVDCLCFCTKNPEPMLKGLDKLNAFAQFWNVTITPYGKDIEPYVPDKETVIEAFRDLSGRVGLAKIGWRYDPIFIHEQYTLAFHIDSFRKMAEKLAGFTDNCVISFIDLYAKTMKNFPGVREVTKEQREIIGKEFAAIGRQYGIKIRSCCEGTDLAVYGVEVSGCMTRAVLEHATGHPLNVPNSKKPPRDACNCLLGNDIGVYNTCGHGCIYCYANYDRSVVLQNMRQHDPASPLLVGNLREGDSIKEAKQASYAGGRQMSLTEWLG